VRAAEHADVSLYAIDDASTDPNVVEILRRAGIEPFQNPTNVLTVDRPLDAWYRAAWTANVFGLKRYAIINEDMLLGKDSLSVLFGAADVLPDARKGMLCAGAVRKRANGDGRIFTAGEFRFCGAGMRRKDKSGYNRKLLLQDGLHIVWPWKHKTNTLQENKLIEYGREDRRMCAVVSPDVQVVHLGVEAHCLPMWGKIGKRHVVRKRPMVNPETGEPTGVAGFDLGEWHIRAKRMHRKDKWHERAIKLPWEGARTMQTVENLRLLGKRIVVEYSGTWEGNRTRKRLGFDLRDATVRLIPIGYQHPWLA
jgi:hypothetical protein